jgi:acyl-CoA synthetase (AMP-forming)/AMP-acid ligase II
MNIAERSDRAWEVYGEYPSVVDDTRTWLASELHDAECRLAAGLIALGVEPGARVVVILPLCGEAIVAARGIWRSGAVAVPLPVDVTETQVTRVVNACMPVALIGLHRSVPLSLAAGRVAHAIGVGPGGAAGGTLTLERLVAEHVPLAASIPREATDLAQITFTSGTTGTPRGVADTHGSLDRLVRRFEPVMWRIPLAKLPVVVSALSPAAFGGVMLRHGLMGMSRLVATATFDPPQFLATIARERATIIGGVPSMFEALLACPDVARRDCSSLRHITVGGAYVSQSLLDRLERRFGIRPTATYGSTEAGGAIVSRDAQSTPGSAGRVLPGAEIAILDEAGHTLPAGEVGEICTRTPWAAQGYYNDPEHTAAVFADGWIRTGDVGYLDAGGELFLLGAAKRSSSRTG